MTRQQYTPSHVTSNRPYLIRAIYEWIVDNGMTPYMLADVSSEQVQVPRELADDGNIVLNIGPAATQSLELGKEAVSFKARFGGEAMGVFIPMAHVLAIYAVENGRGMAFLEDEEQPPETDPSKPDRTRLRVVK